MQLEARMLAQPRPNVGRLVGGVVGEHQMDIAPHWHNLVDFAQEFQELSCPMARQALANHLTGFDVECCEERGRAVALLWLPPVMQELSDRLVACDRVRTSIRPRCAAFPEAAGRDGDLRIRSKSCK